MKTKVSSLQILILSLFVFFGCKKDNCESMNLISNSSFENLNSEGFPTDWEYCSFQNTENPSGEEDEIYSNSEFLKDQSAFDGENYMVLIVTDNGTWEMISYELESGLVQDANYELALAYARKANYVGFSIANQSDVNYTTPAKFNVWGGNSGCEKEELLHSSELIINTRWLIQKLEFTPTQNFSHIIIEAAYKESVQFPYNGNIMIDNVELFQIN